MPTESRALPSREEVAAKLRQQGVLTEPLVQWLVDHDFMLFDLLRRVGELESACAGYGIEPGGPVVDLYHLLDRVIALEATDD